MKPIGRDWKGSLVIGTAHKSTSGERGLCCCAIVAGGTISVTIRARLYELGTDTVTGATKILAAADMPKVAPKIAAQDQCLQIRRDPAGKRRRDP